jgi:hypothetical protein
VQPEELSKLKKFIYLIGSRACNLLACSIVPRTLCYHVPQVSLQNHEKKLICVVLLFYVCTSVCVLALESYSYVSANLFYTAVIGTHWVSV